MEEIVPTADEAWLELLRRILNEGHNHKCRGMSTLEILHDVNVVVDLNHTVVTIPDRKLNYRFMAAEALWIASGRNDVEFLTAVNPRMAEFSDDGRTLSGAYGPRIRPQVPYVLQSLMRDRDTRQAALTIWTPNPGHSKDIPCSIAMVFSIRENRLHQHVFMRSSDAWLGIPYDVFSFSVLAYEIACGYNSLKNEPIGLGKLTITCTSSHLYEEHWDAANKIVFNQFPISGILPTVSVEHLTSGCFIGMIERIQRCMEREPGGEPRYPL